MKIAPNGVDGRGAPVRLLAVGTSMRLRGNRPATRQPRSGPFAFFLHRMWRVQVEPAAGTQANNMEG
jgi:hypothetical protein